MFHLQTRDEKSDGRSTNTATFAVGFRKRVVGSRWHIGMFFASAIAV